MLAQKDDKVALLRCEKKLFKDNVYDYIDEYGYPPTQYEGKMIKFCIYVLE